MNRKEIEAVIQDYFDAGFESDGPKMRNTIHDSAHIFGHDDEGNLSDMNKDTFLELVTHGKQNPQEPGYPRQDEIISIDFTSESTAVAVIKIRVEAIMFTDILSLIKLDGKWWIICKLFSGVAIDA